MVQDTSIRDKACKKDQLPTMVSKHVSNDFIEDISQFGIIFLEFAFTDKLLIIYHLSTSVASHMFILFSFLSASLPIRAHM